MNRIAAPETSRREALRLLMGGLTAACAMPFAHGHEPASSAGVKVTPLMTRPLDGHPGETLTIVLLEFAPGATSEPHRHPGPAFVYVISGTVETQIAGGPLTTLRANDTFYEPAGAIHQVARNASRTEPAKAIAVVVGPKEAPLTRAA